MIDTCDFVLIIGGVHSFLIVKLGNNYYHQEYIMYSCYQYAPVVMASQ